MFKRLLAATSSVVMASGTTAPLCTPVSSGLSGPVELPLVENNAGHVGGAPTQGVVGEPCPYLHFEEYHYAVTRSSLRPIWQNPSKRIVRDVLNARKAQGQATATAERHMHAEHQSHSPQQYDTVSPERNRTSAQKNAPVSLGRRVASIALSLVGLPYRWGGTTRHGFDCSGLVQYIYQKVGIVLPRTSYEQFSVGKPVSWHDLSPGDLLFFTTDAPGASHVAVYVGNGLIVQALNQHAGVVVSHLNDPYYTNRFIGARRP